MEETKTPRRPRSSFSEIEKASNIEATNEHKFILLLNEKHSSTVTNKKKKKVILLGSHFEGECKEI